MKNFSFIHEGDEYWYSRSCTAVAFVFAKCKSTGEWHILANKRGPNAPSCRGKWNVPCGYVDFDERLVEAAARESYEETGVKVPANILHYFHKNDKPQGKKQNIVFLYYGILPGYVEDYTCNLDHMEPGEVEEAKWIPMSHVSDYKWAYQHYMKINRVFETFIDIPWYKKLLIKLHEKLVKYYDVYED